ncbi:KRAB-A domain-containing protein 2-like [Engraulis encrasicolus]|uniref:KRAB-A domain-containing protein 2-like n=1 Tax=Engraulis encrasicolus TaxID=184585 RepID=UPI002FD6A56F
MIGVDLIGPLQKSSKGGNRYLLTATDFFTKWVEARPIKKKQALLTSEAMMDIFLTHGSPEVILTDRGREFWNHVNMSLFDRCGVKHRMTSAYHPQTNGLDERTNQTLKRAIGKTLEGSQERWEDNLKEVLFAHNSSKQASSKFSPFRLMYGREPRLFSEIASDTPEAEVVASVDEDDVSAFMSSRAEKDAAVFVQVITSTKKVMLLCVTTSRRPRKGRNLPTGRRAKRE